MFCKSTTKKRDLQIFFDIVKKNLVNSKKSCNFATQKRKRFGGGTLIGSLVTKRFFAFIRHHTAGADL
jgi:hypothetical protein